MKPCWYFIYSTIAIFRTDCLSLLSSADQSPEDRKGNPLQTRGVKIDEVFYEI